MVGTAKEFADEATERELVPGERLAKLGNGGGGINCESVRTFGTPSDAGPAEDLCALLRLGNMGGVSSCSVSVSSPSPSSSSDGGGENVWTVGVGRDVFKREVPVESQLRRYEVIVV